MAEPTIACSLRQRRSTVGLSQRELAARVGVSRQALVAIEAGRQIPSTSLALQLARALRCTVEDLFALPGGPSLRASLAEPDATGRSRVVLGRVDGRWAAHGIADDTHPGDGLVVGRPKDARADEVTIELLADPARLEHNVLVAGCAPLLGVLAGRLGQRYEHASATWIPANSGRAVELLGRGLVHVAGLHLVEAGTPGGHAGLVRERFPDHATTIVNLTCWRQGLVVAPGNPLAIRGLDDLVRPALRFARREPGAGAHELVRRHFDERGVDAAAWTQGPLASGHAEVARLVRWGVADAGVAIEAAALAEGLEFIALTEERFDLLVPRARVDTAPVARLLDLIDKPAFRAEASRLRGYDLSSAGEVATVDVG